MKLNNHYVLKERPKSGFLHKTEHKNNKSVYLSRPADQQGFSGSERSKGRDEISFTGDPKLIQKLATSVLEKNAEIPNWAQKMGGAEWFKKVLKSVDKNEAAYEALIALVVAGVMKPMCVLAMPGAEREDKEMAATKNAVSAGIGFILSNLILGPCSNAVNRITKSFETIDPTKYVKDQNYINALTDEALVGTAKSTLGDSFKSSFKKFPDLGVSPLKAGVTIALTPMVLNLLFKKDKKKKEAKMKPIDNPINKMTAMNAIRMDASKKPEETKQVSTTNNQNGNNPAFKGKGPEFVQEAIELASEKKNIFSKAKTFYTNVLGEPIARVFGRAATTKPAQWVVEKASHFEKVSPRWSDLASFAITFFYVNNTRKSEKIDEERKLPLMINNVMVTGASSAAAFLIDKYTDKPMENLLKSYITKHETALHDKSNSNIIRVLENALQTEDKELNAFNIKKLLKHGSEIVGENNEKVKDMSSHLSDAIKSLNESDVVKEAIKKNLIKESDVAKMAASGFSQQASKIYKNISKTKSLTIFTLTVRFLVTVLMTPLIGRVVALVNKKLGKESGDSKGKNKTQDNTVPPAGSETIGMKDYMKSLNK